MKKMTYRELEDVCSSMGMRIERRSKYKGTLIYVAEGYCSRSRDYPSPHFRTMDYTGYDPEKLVSGEFFTTPVIFPIMPKSDRLGIAEKKAMEHIDVMRKARKKLKEIPKAELEKLCLT